MSSQDESQEYTPLEPIKLFREEGETYDDVGLTKENLEIIEKGHLRSFRHETAKLFGLVEAIFLGQLDYWIQHPSKNVEVIRGIPWIYHSYEQWHQDLPYKYFSKMMLRRAISKLERLGIVVSRRKLWMKKYTINYGTWALLLHIDNEDEKGA